MGNNLTDSLRRLDSEWLKLDSEISEGITCALKEAEKNPTDRSGIILKFMEETKLRVADQLELIFSVNTLLDQSNANQIPSEIFDKAKELQEDAERIKALLETVQGMGVYDLPIKTSLLGFLPFSDSKRTIFTGFIAQIESKAIELNKIPHNASI